LLPIRLTIKNFLAYRSPEPLQFEGIALACLTGANGAGKSSILDAITWALWGEARAARDEEMIHLGQTDMSVQLEFEQEGTHYRVIRKRTRKGSGGGTLDLYSVMEDATLNLISVGSKSETQKQINALLRLDYDTFVHSAFLQQGKADAFTTMGPTKRKQLLRDMLGLERWSEYERAAKDALERLEAEIRLYDARLADTDEALRREPEYLAERDAALLQQEEAQSALTTAELLHQEVAQAPNEYKAALARRTDTERRIHHYEGDLYSARKEKTARLEAIARDEGVLNEREAILDGYQALQQARDASETLGDKMRQLSDLDARRRTVERTIETETTALQRRLDTHESKIAHLRTTIAKAQPQALADAQAEFTALGDIDGDRDQVQTALMTLEGERAGLESQNRTLKAEMKVLGDRKMRLLGVEAAICPFCGQPLDAPHRERLIAEITEEGTPKGDLHRENSAHIQTIMLEITQQKSEQEAIAARMLTGAKLKERIAVMRSAMDGANEAQIALNAAETEAEALREILTTDTYALDARSEMNDIDLEREALGYDSARHKEAQQELKRYNEYERRHLQLEEAEARLPVLREGLAHDEAREAGVSTLLEEERAGLIRVIEDIDALIVRVREEQTRREAREMQRSRLRDAESHVTIARQNLHSIEASRKRREELGAQKAAARESATIYEELKAAFSKNGVQAMIIETAIPELETGANRLLSQMTDGRMRITLNTQREKVTGGVAETLDIDIEDELGKRSYELYSGGEAFRINFALRIALSQLLARRAGAHLRTLFIDEGFGTQDEDGRGKLVEAINAIQDHFDLILVITHIDDLRDSFPVHIEVEKTPDGSQISIR